MFRLLLVLFFSLPALAQDSTPLPSTKFSVVELNTWGVPFAVPYTWRYGEAMQAIEKISPDFVFLEEVFSSKGKREFESWMYPYEANGPKAQPLRLTFSSDLVPHVSFKLIGGGVRILSKYPIERNGWMSYTNCVADDCLSNKGAAFAIVDLPDGTKITLVVTHLNARGDDSVREAQVNELKAFMEYYAEPNTPILLIGDFNFGPKDPAYGYWIQKTLETNDAQAWHDGWVDTHANGDPGLTYDPVINQYAHDYCVKYGFPLDQDRIDLMFTQGNVRATSSKLIFNELPFYSDHFGLYAEYEILHNQVTH